MLGLVGGALMWLASRVGTAGSGIILLVTICGAVTVLVMVLTAVMTYNGRQFTDDAVKLNVGRDNVHYMPVRGNAAVEDDSGVSDTISLGWMPGDD